jgi:hypothetical protein
LTDADWKDVRDGHEPRSTFSETNYDELIIDTPLEYCEFSLEIIFDCNNIGDKWDEICHKATFVSSEVGKDFITLGMEYLYSHFDVELSQIYHLMAFGNQYYKRYNKPLPKGAVSIPSRFLKLFIELDAIERGKYDHIITLDEGEVSAATVLQQGKDVYYRQGSDMLYHTLRNSRVHSSIGLLVYEWPNPSGINGLDMKYSGLRFLEWCDEAKEEHADAILIKTHGRVDPEIDKYLKYLEKKLGIIEITKKINNENYEIMISNWQKNCIKCQHNITSFDSVKYYDNEYVWELHRQCAQQLKSAKKMESVIHEIKNDNYKKAREVWDQSNKRVKPARMSCSQYLF